MHVHIKGAGAADEVSLEASSNIDDMTRSSDKDYKPPAKPGCS
jgi:hypothetical protein